MFQINHVLPRRFATHTVIKFLINRFDPNGIGNLMALPSENSLASAVGSSPHTGGHLGTYYAGFERFLRCAENSQNYKDARDGDPAALDQLSADLIRFVATAKYALANGHLLANTPEGMTNEDANRKNLAWFLNWKTYADNNRQQIQEMQDAVGKLHDSGRRDEALYWPVLSSTRNPGIAEQTGIPRRPDSSSQFTTVGPLPSLPGFVPPVVDSQLPGLIPPSLDGLNRTEGFTPSNPLRIYGLPGFPTPDPSLQRLGQLPPSTPMPQDPLVLKFDPATGWPSPFSDRSPILEPDAPATGTPPAALYGAAGLAALAVAVPALLPLWAMLGATIAATAPASANTASATGKTDGGVFSTGAAPYSAFNNNYSAPPINGGGYGRGPASGPPSIEPADTEPADADSPSDRSGNWSEAPAGTRYAQTLGALGAPEPSSAGTVRPEDVRRLTRVNASNSVNAFASGSAPVPYLSPTFDDRFGARSPSSVDRQSLPASRPIGVFADDPGYSGPPPIWGLEDRGGTQRNDAEEWFPSWIRPYLRQE